MAIINDLDLGVHPTWLVPYQTQTGQIARLSVNSVKVRGYREFFYGESTEMPERAETVYVVATQAVGPYAAGTQNATLALVDQLLELVGNPDLNKPCYIQWASGGGVTTVDPQDGWYYITSAEPDKEFVWSAVLPVKLSVRKVSAAGSRRIGVWWSGGALVSSYGPFSGSAINIIGFPLNAISLQATFARAGAEGAVTSTQFSPVVNPAPFVPPPISTDLFRGGCHVYDVMAPIATNPIGGGNLVTDPGFETNPGGWVFSGVGSGGSLFSSANVHSGSWALRQTNPSAGNYGSAFQSIGIPVTAGQTLAASGWGALLAPGPANLTGPFRITFANLGTAVLAGGIAISQPSGQAGTTFTDLNVSLSSSTFAQFSENVTVPAGYQYAFVEIFANGSVPQTTFWDDIVVTTAHVNPNWIEVKGLDHRFVGDVVLTNGLLLLLFSPGSLPGISFYLWNTALSPLTGWQKIGDLYHQDGSAGNGTLRQVSLLRCGVEESTVFCTTSTVNGMVADLTFRLQRFMYHSRFDFRPRSQNQTNVNALFINFTTANPKILYNSGATVSLVDNQLASQLQPTAASVYGYAAALTAQSTANFVSGWLYMNTPLNQPTYNNANAVGYGDSNGPAVNETRAYGIFAAPWANSQNYQAEAETNVAAPWTSTVDTASAAHAAFLSAGNVNANNQYQCNTNFAPPAGTYAFWVRVRTGTIGAGTNAEVLVFLQNSTASTFAIAALTPAGVNSTTYVWKLAGTLFFNGTDVAYFGVKANGTFTTTVQWFIDEVVMAPTSVNGLGPQDIWQQFMFDRTTEIVMD